MSVENEVKKASRRWWLWLIIGIFIGGTVLALPVAKFAGWVKLKVANVRGGTGAANVAAAKAAS